MSSVTSIAETPRFRISKPTAATVGIPLLDLRVICNHANDYSNLSPIEPSVVGGAKIADAICRAVVGHDFATKRTAVWV